MREGNLILINNEIFKVEEIDLKGSAKAHKTVSLKLRSIPEGKFKEITLNHEDKVDEAVVVHRKAAYSYSDGDSHYFADPETFEQYPLRKELVGGKEIFLKEELDIHIVFYQDAPIEAVFPKRVRLKVANADKGVHGGGETTFKKARLENGMEIDVPQFVVENDIVEVDTDTGHYVDRVQE
ncbi:MAG: hypothetical protein PHS37_07220 [Candidatus Omnitrophica bacterium]|nr:hypothetical protein [Candidatus Omnitrophota bacterium]